MPPKEPEIPAQVTKDFTTLREIVQFVSSIIQRRYGKQQQLKFGENLQAKYVLNHSQIGRSVENLQQKFLPRISILRKRSLQQHPWHFAQEIPWQSAIFHRAQNQKAVEFVEDISAKSFTSSTRIDKSITTAAATESVAPPQVPAQNRDKELLEAENLETRIEQSNYLVLDPQIKHSLSQLLNIHIPFVKIYTNELTDKLVKKYNADALAYPNKILFRLGKYSPQSRTGIALLGHELTHINQLNLPKQNVPETTENEEREALINEQKILHHFSFPQTIKENAIPSNFNSTPSQVISQPSHIHPQTPKAALSSRDLNLPPEANSTLNTSSQLTEAQLNFIKEEVYRDLRNRIREESERGS